MYAFDECIKYLKHGESLLIRGKCLTIVVFNYKRA